MKGDQTGQVPRNPSRTTSSHNIDTECDCRTPGVNCRLHQRSPKKTGRREKNRQGKTSGTSPEEKDKDSDMIKKVLEEGSLSLHLRRKQRKMEG